MTVLSDMLLKPPPCGKHFFFPSLYPCEWCIKNWDHRLSCGITVLDMGYRSTMGVFTKPFPPPLRCGSPV